MFKRLANSVPKSHMTGGCGRGLTCIILKIEINVVVVVDYIIIIFSKP